jgi:hypothetical protein
LLHLAENEMCSYTYKKNYTFFNLKHEIEKNLRREIEKNTTQTKVQLEIFDKMKKSKEEMEKETLKCKLHLDLYKYLKKDEDHGSAYF